jgi:hypothetical protein
MKRGRAGAMSEETAGAGIGSVEKAALDATAARTHRDLSLAVDRAR